MSDHYIVIEDFFSALPLAHYRKYISSLLDAANSNKYWKKEDPGSLLYFQKKLEDLIDAVHPLVKKDKDKKSKKSKAILAPDALDQEVVDPGLYADKLRGHTQWESFPRYLSKAEFLNPYLVFERFFRYRSQKEWHKDIKEIMFYALSPHSCADDCIDFEFLKINQLLQKLVEAAHLILVREINPDHVAD